MALKRLVLGSLLVSVIFGLNAASSIKPAQAASTVAIYQANLQHGQYTDNSFNYQGQAAILAPGTDIVTTNEVSGSDLPSWDQAFMAQGMTRALYFANSTLGDGNAIWYRPSTVTLLGTYSHKLSTGFIGWDGSTDVDKSAVAAKVSVSGQVFYVVSAHLCWSRCADKEGSTYSVQRVSQINELMNWISTTLTDADVVIAGDMNFAPNYPRLPDPALQIDLITPGYDDLWQTGLATGQASAPWGDRDNDGLTDMPLDNLQARTSDSRRVDYFFLKKNATALSLSSITIPDLRAPCPQPLVGGACPNVIQRWGFAEDAGVRPSDHNWVKTVFNLGSVTPPVDTTSPTVSLTAPAEGTTVSGAVPVTASATDDVGVSGVQFKLDGMNLGQEDTTAPYFIPWDTTAIADGAHQLSAVVRDAAGNSSTAVPVTVTVNNVILPTASLLATLTNITAGQTTILSWTSGNAANVNIDQGIGTVAASGSTIVSPTVTTTYTLTATNTKGSITATATVTVSAPPVPLPLAPTNLTGTGATTQIQLAWKDNATNESGYKLERCKGSGCTAFTALATVGANAVTFIDSGLNKNNVYRYRVRAYNSSGGSAYSNIAEVKTSK